MHRHLPRTTTIPRASFTYSVSPDHILQITDDVAGKSVTNDIANVLRAVSQDLGHPLTGYRVIYRDTMGTWDGVELNARGEFSRFYPIGTTDQAEALASVRARA